MRRCTNVVMVIGLLLVATGASWAFSLFDYVEAGDKVVFKYRNWDEGTTYTDPLLLGTTTGSQLAPNPADLDGYASILPIGSPAGEDAWGIFTLTQIFNEADSIHPIWEATSALEEITGIFWGEKDTRLDDSGLGTSHVQLLQGIDMQVAFFSQLKSDIAFTAFDPSAGPGARATPLPYYPTATDGDLLYTFNSVYGHRAVSNAEFFTDFYPTPAAGTDSVNGGFFMDAGAVDYWGVGPGNIEIAEYIPGVADATVKFSGVPDPTDGWLVQSDDPMRTAVTPELSSSALMLLGFVPMGLGWWRRRKA